MLKRLENKYIEILIDARDETEGTISRTHLLNAFKKAGASVRKEITADSKRKELCLIYPARGPFRLLTLPIGTGDIRLNTAHTNWRDELSKFAALLIKENNIETPNQHEQGFSVSTATLDQ